MIIVSQCRNGLRATIEDVHMLRETYFAIVGVDLPVKI